MGRWKTIAVVAVVAILLIGMIIYALLLLDSKPTKEPIFVGLVLSADDDLMSIKWHGVLGITYTLFGHQIRVSPPDPIYGLSFSFLKDGEFNYQLGELKGKRGESIKFLVKLKDNNPERKVKIIANTPFMLESDGFKIKSIEKDGKLVDASKTLSSGQYVLKAQMNPVKTSD